MVGTLALTYDAVSCTVMYVYMYMYTCIRGGSRIFCQAHDSDAVRLQRVADYPAKHRKHLTAWFSAIYHEALS